MANKQYLRNIEEGDTAFEGRSSNGIVAKADGTTLLYSGVSKVQLEQLETQTDVTNVSIDGNVGSIVAIIPAEKNVEYPEGNNNKETVQPPTDPNKVTTPSKTTTKGFKTIITTSATITIPNNATGPVSVFVFYPGIKSGGQIGKQYMPPKIKKGIPDFYDKYVIVIPNEDTTEWNSVKKEYEAELKKANLSEKNLSLGIFSGSGNDNRSIQGVLKILPNLVNLIIMDPWPGQIFSNNVAKVKSKNTKVYMMYNPDVWNSYKSYPGLIPNLVAKIDPDKLSKVKIGHLDIPEKMLTKYRTEIENNLGPVTTIPEQQTQSQLQQQPTQQLPPSSEPEKIPEPAPSINEEEETENFIFLDETGVELDPIAVIEPNDTDQSDKISYDEQENFDKKESEKLENSPKNEIKIKSDENKLSRNINDYNIERNPVTGNDSLLKNNKGETIATNDLVTAALISIDTTTQKVPGTKSKKGTLGGLGCASAVSIMLIRASGVGPKFKDEKNKKGGKVASIVIGTASLNAYLKSDKDNWAARANWKDAQPGDIINTVTVDASVANGHIGVVVDTKENDGKSWDVVSNSSSGYAGAANKKKKCETGSIQKNYSVDRWGDEIANRKGVGPTYAWYFTGGKLSDLQNK